MTSTASSHRPGQDGSGTLISSAATAGEEDGPGTLISSAATAGGKMVPELSSLQLRPAGEERFLLRALSALSG